MASERFYIASEWIGRAAGAIFGPVGDFMVAAQEDNEQKLKKMSDFVQCLAGYVFVSAALKFMSRNIPDGLSVEYFARLLVYLGLLLFSLVLGFRIAVLLGAFVVRVTGVDTNRPPWEVGGDFFKWFFTLAIWVVVVVSLNLVNWQITTVLSEIALTQLPEEETVKPPQSPYHVPSCTDDHCNA